MSIVTGDALAIPAQCQKDGAAFVIDPGATVEAAIVNSSRSTVLAGPVTCSSLTTGADWANSLVIAEFTEAQSAAIEVDEGTGREKVYLEIQVDDGGTNTWFFVLDVVKGNIP